MRLFYIFLIEFEPIMTKEAPLPSECVNCGAEFTGDYCHSCGQRRKVRRLTFGGAWLDFQQHILGLDNKFFRTFKSIWVNPGGVAKANIEGNRVRYMGPVSYFFVVVTLLLLIISIFGVKWTDFLRESTEAFDTSQTERQQQFQQDMMTQIYNNFRVFQFFVIPFFALAAKMLFRKSGYNFLEHMVLVFYIQAQMVFVTILNLGFYLTIDQTFLRLSMPISFLFYGFACTGFYPGTSKWKRFIKGMLVQLIGLLFFMIAFTFIGVIAVIIYSLMNPEWAEQFKPAA